MPRTLARLLGDASACAMLLLVVAPVLAFAQPVPVDPWATPDPPPEPTTEPAPVEPVVKPVHESVIEPTTEPQPPRRRHGGALPS